MKDLIKEKFEVYISKKTRDHAFDILSKENYDNPLNDIFMFIIPFSIIIFLSCLINSYFSEDSAMAFLIFTTPVLMFYSVYSSKQREYKYFCNKVDNMDDTDLKNLFRMHCYYEFLDTDINDEILDILKLKYSAEQFKELILSSKNKIPTYSEVITFHEKYELIEDSKYKVDIKNIKKEKILNLAQ